MPLISAMALAFDQKLGQKLAERAFAFVMRSYSHSGTHPESPGLQDTDPPHE